jgi:hypothetical protein
MKIKEPIIAVIEYVCNKLAMFLPFFPFGLIYTQDEIITFQKYKFSSDPNIRVYLSKIVFY